MIDRDKLNEALSGNYMLVDLQLRSWSGKRTDKVASDEIIASKMAARDSGAFVKNLLASAGQELKEVHTLGGALRQYVYANTLPWSSSSDGAKRGERLLATSKSFEFLKGLQDIKLAYDAAVNGLVAAWPVRVAEAMTNLAGLARVEDYPTTDDLPGMFGVNVNLKPVPSISDYTRLNVPAALAEALGQRHIAQAEVQIKNAMEDLRDRLIVELQRIERQLGKHGKGEKTPLYDSLRTNMQGLVDLARNMNVTQNPRLAELADKIESKLLQVPIEAYKNSVTLSAAAATEAQALATEAAMNEIWE